jgi:hypothetical protein
LVISWSTMSRQRTGSPLQRPSLQKPQSLTFPRTVRPKRSAFEIVYESTTGVCDDGTFDELESLNTIDTNVKVSSSVDKMATSKYSTSDDDENYDDYDDDDFEFERKQLEPVDYLESIWDEYKCWPISLAGAVTIHQELGRKYGLTRKRGWHRYRCEIRHNILCFYKIHKKSALSIFQSNSSTTRCLDARRFSDHTVAQHSKPKRSTFPVHYVVLSNSVTEIAHNIKSPGHVLRLTAVHAYTDSTTYETKKNVEVLLLRPEPFSDDSMMLWVHALRDQADVSRTVEIVTESMKKMGK